MLKLSTATKSEWQARSCLRRWTSPPDRSSDEGQPAIWNRVAWAPWSVWWKSRCLANGAVNSLWGRFYLMSTTTELWICSESSASPRSSSLTVWPYTPVGYSFIRPFFSSSSGTLIDLTYELFCNFRRKSSSRWTCRRSLSGWSPERVPMCKVGCRLKRPYAVVQQIAS